MSVFVQLCSYSHIALLLVQAKVIPAQPLSTEVLREGSAAPGHAPSCRWLLRHLTYGVSWACQLVCTSQGRFGILKQEMHVFEGTLDSCIHQKLSCTLYSCTIGELCSHVTLYFCDTARDKI